MIKFFEEDDLLDRLIYAAEQKVKPVVFIVGSPLTASYKDSHGVLNVDEIVNIIREEFSRDSKVLAKLDEALSSTKQFPYQSAFEFLIGRRGPEYANQIIRKSVIKARIKENELSSELLRNEQSLNTLERDITGWSLPPAVKSLGALCVDFKDVFGRVVLTTNFDPLIEIAVKANNGDVFSSMTHGDGNISQATGSGLQVVHLHGYWRGSDTLHTPTQLTHSRVQLKNSLTTLIKNSLVVVLAYGGWDDVITDAISDAIADDSSYPEVIWTFYSRSDQDICAKNDSLIKKLSTGISRGRATLYRGIDCHNFLPMLHKTLITSQGGSLSEPEILDVQIIEENIDIIRQPRVASTIDAFPKNELWYGRESEINTLLKTSAKIISISGMGGEGKSALASSFMQTVRDPAFKNNIFDWRDCREQSSTMHMALCGATGRLTAGLVNTTELLKMATADVIQLFIQELPKFKGIFVFDNIDNYVDLETSQPLDQVKKLIDAVLATPNSSKIILTSRPRISVEHSDFQEVQLKGISKEASKNLFDKKSLRRLDANELNDLYDLTQGHPLWISIIASQCAATGKAPLALFSEMRSGKANLPERAMRGTWSVLTSKAQHLLRVLAELERPENQENLEDLVNMRWNHLSKALSNLKKMSLIVFKESDDGKELIDLHPLIRQFVRIEFPKKDRESFINLVITYVDRRISRLGALIGVSIPAAVLDIWVHKVELVTNQQNYDLAIETLVSIESELQKKGLHGEIVRLGKKIFQEIDWVIAMQSTAKFDAFVSETIHSIVILEGFEEAEKWIAKYEQFISGKGAHYINLCEIRAYINWFVNNHDDAIHWASLGLTLKKDYDVITHHSCAHTLALAQRDSGKATEALDFFLEGVNLAEVLTGAGIEQKNGPYFGNVGRCLQLMGRPEDALVSYRLAASHFEKEGGDTLNQGYLRYWVGQVMEDLNRVEDALYFYTIAINKWHSITPQRTIEVQLRLDDLLADNPDLIKILNTPQWKAENRFVEWSKST